MARSKKVSLSAALKYGFHAAVDNLKLFIPVLLVAFFFFFGKVFAFALMVGVHLMKSFHDLPNTEHMDFFASEMSLLNLGVAAVLYLIFKLIDSAILLGLTKVALELYDTNKSKVKTLFSCTHLLFKHLWATILYHLITVVGLMLFVIPGLIWMVRYGYYQYVMADKGTGTMASLHESARITQGVKGDLLVLQFVLFLINAVGLSLFGLGVFISMPITLMTNTYVYRKLNS